MTAKPPPARKSNGIAAAITGITFLFTAAWFMDSWRPNTVGHFRLLVSLFLIIAGVKLIQRRHQISTANLLLVLVSCAVGFSIAEIALTVTGAPPLKRIVWRAPEVEPWWGASANGQVRFLPDKYDGPWTINPQGFPDTDDFAQPPAAPRRILLLGDSFAYGASATTQAKSFAELLDAALDATTPTTIWNFAIPGTGQQEQLELLADSDMDAQLVIATLFRNDFADNTLPPWRFYVFTDGAWVDRLAAAEGGGFAELTPTQAYRRAFGVERLRDLPKASRTASAVAGLLRRLDGPEDAQEPAPTPGYEHTKSLVDQLKSIATARGAAFMLVLIPDRSDLSLPSAVYADSLRLCSELDLTCIDLRKDLRESDYAPVPDTHWNDSGHAKVAARLQREIESMALKTDEPVADENGSGDPIR